MATVPRILRLTDGDAVAPDGTRFALLHVVAGERHHLGWFELTGDAWQVGLTSAGDVTDAGVPAAEVRAATAAVLDALRTARDEDDMDVPPPIGPIVNTLRLAVDRRRAITRLEGELRALDPGAVSIDADDMEAFRRVVDAAGSLPPDHPDAVAVRRAVSGVYKTARQQRREERRDAIRANDDAVTAATATGAPGRIDDETRGLPLVASAAGATAGTLMRARACYVCKRRYTEVNAFHHQLCAECAARNRERRDARADLTGRTALLTGGRAKIGMYVALRLLRDGAHTTITTRFPRDAARRFTAMPDSGDWLHRLRIVGIDLRDPGQVVALAEAVAARGPLDILINNAAQTVRRSPGAYAPLAAAEAAPLPAGPAPEVLSLAPGGVRGTVGDGSPGHWTPTPQALAELALTAGSASPERVAARRAIDAGGLVPDLQPVNSWIQTVNQVDPVEMLEVQLCNMTAPFILVGRLRAALAAATARRRYVVNVSAMEGQFSRGYKGPGHPHTNMAKAALNMLTRTSATELHREGILMTSVNTGWITDERPHPTRARLAGEGFHAPLDLVDGAARVYDPIVRGERGEDLFGCFLKDYEPSPW